MKKLISILSVSLVVLSTSFSAHAGRNNFFKKVEREVKRVAEKNLSEEERLKASRALNEGLAAVSGGSTLRTAQQHVERYNQRLVELAEKEINGELYFSAVHYDDVTGTLRFEFQSEQAVFEFIDLGAKYPYLAQSEIVEGKSGRAQGKYFLIFTDLTDGEAQDVRSAFKL